VRHRHGRGGGWGGDRGSGGHAGGGEMILTGLWCKGQSCD
jgi:hypothetical protein